MQRLIQNGKNLAWTSQICRRWMGECWDANGGYRGLAVSASQSVAWKAREANREQSQEHYKISLIAQ